MQHNIRTGCLRTRWHKLFQTQYTRMFVCHGREGFSVMESKLTLGFKLTTTESHDFTVTTLSFPLHYIYTHYNCTSQQGRKFETDYFARVTINTVRLYGRTSKWLFTVLGVMTFNVSDKLCNPMVPLVSKHLQVSQVFFCFAWVFLYFGGFLDL